MKKANKTLKRFIKYILCAVFITTLFTDYSFAQLDCQYTDVVGESIASPFIGRVKPNVTTLSGGNPSPAEAYFPVLIVFVQFQDDADWWDWPDKNSNGGKPIYLDSLIASPVDYDSTSNWWNAYDENTQIVSDQWMEISRGSFHVLGRAYSVVLSGNRASYTDEFDMNQEIIDSLIAQNVLFESYDLWRKDGTTNEFVYESDERVDMMYRFTKSIAPGMTNANGYNHIGGYGTEHMIITGNDTTYVNTSAGALGSGVTLSGYDKRANLLGGMFHEHGHQTYSGGHQTYSRVSYGFGFEGFYSPYDMVLNEFMEEKVFTYSTSNPNYTLGDYSSRNSEDEGNILKVPIAGNEYFLLAHRNKVSKWDRPMTGDTGQLNAYSITNDYGKGLYIYHIKNGINFPTSINTSPQDMECADGYFEWEYVGQAYQNLAPTCYNSNPDLFHYYKKKSVLYTNDDAIIGNSNPYGDGISFHHLSRPKWWGFGKKEASNCELGTDRILTNDKDVYTSKEIQGDRYDAWVPGYNEVFSPYSSPSTVKWNDTESGIFIWYHATSHDEASLKIWSNGTTPDSTILELTPPSRPMGLKDTACVFSNNHFRPKILWNHNMEPDMVRGGGLEPEYKRYRVYRSVADNMTLVPPDALVHAETVYTLIETVDISPGVRPSYVDTAVISACYLPDGQCPPDCWVEYPVRYRITAVDKYDDVSVASDFVCTKGIKTESGDPGGKDDDNISGISTDNEIPKEFALKQNYPNPFNPSTNIQFDLPKDRFVTIKIYDITGREIAVLVNEFKKAGSYIVAFDGSSLSSGIYYYTIRAENFKETKRMVLLK